MDKFITIEEAIDTGVIPKDYADMFKTLKKCKCGHPYIINTNATIMKCSNINCIRMLAGRAEEIYKKFGLTGWGQIELEKYIYTAGIQNMYQVLIKPPVAVGPEIYKWLDSKHTPVEILQMLNLPNLGINCEKVFDGVEDFEHFKLCIDRFSWFGYFADYGLEFREEDLKFKRLVVQYKVQTNSDFNLVKKVFHNKYETNIMEENWEQFNDALFKAGLKYFMQNQFNYNGNNSGIMAEKVYNILWDYWTDIECLFTRVKCLVDNRQEIPIVITGDVLLVTDDNGTGFKEKIDFVNYLNIQAEPLNIKFNLCSKVKTTPFILADTEANTAKYREGIRRGVLFNSYEIITAVKNLIKLGKFNDSDVETKINALTEMMLKARNL